MCLGSPGPTTPFACTRNCTPTSAPTSGVLGLDNFNDYNPVSLKRARQLHSAERGVYTVEGDINNMDLLQRLFSACHFTHVVHMAAQVGWHWLAVAQQSRRADCPGVGGGCLP